MMIKYNKNEKYGNQLKIMSIVKTWYLSKGNVLDHSAGLQTPKDE